MTSINNGKYTEFSADVNELISKAMHIYVTISSDNSGSVIVADNNGSPISKKLIVSMNYTYPSNEVLGSYKITFSDNNFIVISDEDTTKWYILEGTEPYGFKQLI